ncbi:MAG: discoidin domain-containing protein [Sedimentisphaerales bacterium]|nr:discoidin domain-containing protein [Sedimentisphaerales bacterium]
MKKTLVLAIVAGVMWISSAEVSAVNYYVDATGGNDSWNGNYPSYEGGTNGPWQTISKVNSYNFQTGDNVFFKCGGTWNAKTRLRIDWSGLDDANRAVIGAYYMSESNPVIGVNSDGKPVFDGKWDTANEHGTTIELYGAHYIIVQDLKLYNSYGYGVRGNYGDLSSHITLRRLGVDYIGSTAIYFHQALGADGIIEYCNVSRSNLKWYLGLNPTWGAAIVIKTNNTIARYNQVHEGHGEGINLGAGDRAYNVLVENNFVWATQSVGIYMDGSRDGIVRNNVVLGTTDTTYHKTWVYGGRTWSPAGIGFNNETTNDSSLRNKVYGNVVIGYSVGINSINKSGEVVGYDNRQLVYNNTFIDNYYNINTHVSELMDTEYRNNLSIIHDDAAAIGSKHVYHNSNMGTTYFPLGNFWSSEPELAGWSHPNDIIGDAKLFKTSGWQNISKPSDIDIAQAFALTQGSDAIDTAQDLGDDYAEGFTIGTNFNTPDASDYNTPIVVELVDQNDYYGWDFGAFVYTGDVPDPCCGECSEEPIDQSGWELEYVDSEEMGDVDRPATNSFDGDPDTFWHTEWSLTDPDPAHPHEIQIDLGGFYDICGFRYLPRQDEGPGEENGMIGEYEFYVSSDPCNWGTAVASGTLAKDKAEKQVSFDHKLGQYIRLIALSEVNDNPWTTMAELNVLAVQPDLDINDDGKVNIEDFAVLATWWDDENACSTTDWCGGSDFDMSGTIDFFDLAYFAENWLR